MFFLTRLLAFLPFGNFLRGPLGKILLVGGLILILYFGFQIWLNRFENTVRENALLEFNQAQIELVEEIRQNYEAQIQAILAEQEERLAALEAEREVLEAEAQELLQRLESGEFEGREDEASPVLREAIRLLQERANGG